MPVWSPCDPGLDQASLPSCGLEALDYCGARMADNGAKIRGWIFYDGECRFCIASMKRWGGLFARRGFVWLTLQTPGTASRLGVTESQLREAMWLQCADGRKFSGVDAWARLLRSVWWLWLFGMLLSVPGLRGCGAAGYRAIARNRHCFAGVCAIHPHDRDFPESP